MILQYMFFVLVVTALVGISILFYLRFSSTPSKTNCQDIPHGIVVMAPAFWNLGKDPKTGKFIPGLANISIAQNLEECADRFSLVLTQKAVSDVWKDGTILPNGTPVQQMHKDCSHTVGTLEAFACAVEWLEEHNIYPMKTIGLIAQEKHLARSHQALKAVLRFRHPDTTIVDIHLGIVRYQDDAWDRPWQWAIYELVKWPVQTCQILIGYIFGFKCSNG
jgi:hypothetical protein